MNDEPGGLIKELGAPVIILNKLFRQDATKEVVGSVSQEGGVNDNGGWRSWVHHALTGDPLTRSPLTTARGQRETEVVQRPTEGEKRRKEGEHGEEEEEEEEQQQLEHN